jgi:DNA invertase Pin-like site-specific DNA recombinase
MTVYGYARVSTDGQSLTSQDAELHAAGCAKVYAEKISGARSNRPELAKVLKRLDTGDVLIVTRLDRLARSTRDLLKRLANGEVQADLARSYGVSQATISRLQA